MCARSWLWSAENSGNMSSKLSNEYATLLDEIEPEDEGDIMTSGLTSFFEDGDGRSVAFRERRLVDYIGVDWLVSFLC
ncbi:hypothetical protein P8452_12722 [Trifolium repens]|nr:hypothetical protein P8452_12722 [Trifolium repens]